MTVTVLKIAAGIGKTTVVAEAIAHYHGFVEVYVATHKLAIDWQRLIREQNPTKRIAIIYGRSSETSEGQPLCKKSILADELARAGCAVFPNLCSQSRGANTPPVLCEHYSGCAYFAQFGFAEVRIYVHAHLGLERSVLEQQQPGMVVIDETFWTSCVKRLEITIEQLRHSGLPEAARALCRQVADALSDDRNQIPEVIRAADESGQLQQALRALRNAGAIASPEMNARQLRKRINSALPLQKIRVMLRQLGVECVYDRPPQSVTFCSKTGQVTVHHRMAITRFSQPGLRRSLAPTAKFLLLDASADRLIIEQFFDVTDFHEISVERNAYVIQCHSTSCSKSRLVLGPNASERMTAEAELQLANIQKIVDQWAARYGKLLVIGPAAVTGNERTKQVPLLNRPGNATFAHFGAIRGIDAWKDYDAVIIIGRNQPSVEAVEDYGRALYFDHKEPLQLGRDLSSDARGYSLRDGEYGVNVQVHPDTRIQAVVEQIRERESEQAMDRLRLVHHQGAPKSILLLSNLPLDVDVDELRTMKELTQGGSRVEQAMGRCADGVLLLRPEWLASTFPELWPSEAAAKKDVARKRGQTSNRNTIRGLSLFEHQYKPRRQRRWSRCLSQDSDPAIVAQKLGIKLGEVVEVKPAQPS